MKEHISGVDWTNPENHVDQHRIRYMDQALHTIFIDTKKSVTYKGIESYKWDDSLKTWHAGTREVDKTIPHEELQRIRDHVLFKRRKNFADTGGDKTMVDTNIDFGAQAQVIDPETGLIVIHKKI